MRSYRGLLSVLVLGGFQCLCTSASSAINVALEASFNSPPYLIELLETAAEENSTAYFPLLDRIADGYFDRARTDRELYTSFIQLLQDGGHLTDAESLSSFQFALSIHSAAPRIEAHYQYYETSVEPSLDVEEGIDCETWVHFGGRQLCSPELDKEHGFVGHLRVVDLPFDHVLGDTDHGLPSILYADLTSPSFRRFHRTLSHTAREGKTSYRVRYKPSKTHPDAPLVVHGYGVGLSLKRTDYIVIDDRQAEQADKNTLSKPAEASLQDAEIADIKPLSASELSGLGMRAASFVMDSSEPLNTLLKLTQDFPKHSSSISAHNISAAFAEEHYSNRGLLLPPGFNILWINGVPIDARSVDAFSLLDHLRRERKLIEDIRKLGFTGHEAISILSHEAIAEAQADDQPQRYDYRDDTEGGNVIMWMNDIEKDKRYDDWPRSINALLQRTFPGQLPPVRRDIHNAIMPVDFSDSKDAGIVVETLQSLIRRKVPVRWGLVPVIKTAVAAEQAAVVYHLLDTYGLGAVLSYLEKAITAKKLSTFHKSLFESVIKGRKLRKGRTAQPIEDILQLESIEERLKGSKMYLSRLGAETGTAPLFVNGAPISKDDDWLQNLSNRITTDLRIIQQGVFEELLDEDTWLPLVFLAEASLRRNPLIAPEDKKTVRLLNLVNIYNEHRQVVRGLPRLPVGDTAERRQWAHLVVVGDFDSEGGRRLVAETVDFRKDHDNIEVVFIHSGESSVAAAGLSVPMFKLVEEGRVQSLDSFGELLANPEASDQPASSADVADAANFWATAMPLIRSLGLAPGQAGVVLNGRLVGPLSLALSIDKEDLEALLQYESNRRIEPTMRAVEGLGLFEKIRDPKGAAELTSLVAISSISDVPEGIYESASTARTNRFNQWGADETAITIGDIETAVIQVVTSVDPASEVAQRWTPILKVLSELAGVHMRVFLNPRDKLEELPIKRFYRYVLDSKPSFNDNGSLHGSRAFFIGIPPEVLLTMGLDVPAPWLVAPKESVHDLDNIKLSSLRGDTNVDAIYELENILVEGHSRDMTSGAPPRGVQLVLGTAKDPHFADTIIMANLGYFQFKTNPGYFKIELQTGRSQDIFNIDSIGTKGYSPQPGDETTEVALTSFQGVTLYPRLSRKPGQETEDVLEAAGSAATDLAAKASNIADQVIAKAGVKGVRTGKYLSKALKLGSALLRKARLSADGKPTAHADINIFSVASGHLYERMLNIMMVSVMKHTKHSVKFWFIEQFLSPSFKSFLPTLAAEYNFSYEMVTYKWPHWLRAQKEKQREIWGYKILFLDVLFPLDLDKVIFVDADQIVRTDMYELVTHDLQGAPYGFTPMCDSRTEMEGFRFWKQGYWKQFLRGLPYHISALYVVDLKRFRQIAAGDRLRGQYHQLSADPASLSNLDQDLPNNMQMILPIHSLPQEWLWCETWCSDESLKDAKTIDLCNNPLTKEPKLDRARRQVPEWTAYDEEIAALARRTKEGDGEGAKAPVAREEDVVGGSVEADQVLDDPVGESRPSVRDEL